MTNAHPYSISDGNWTDFVKYLQSILHSKINMCLNESPVTCQCNGVDMGALTRPGRGKGAVLPDLNFD